MENGLGRIASSIERFLTRLVFAASLRRSISGMRVNATCRIHSTCATVARNVHRSHASAARLTVRVVADGFATMMFDVEFSNLEKRVIPQGA